MKVIFSENALEETDIRNFPLSKHRSRRIQKKLVKRFGGEFKKVPCMFKTPVGFIVHPNLKPKIEAAIRTYQQPNYWISPIQYSL